MGFRRNIGSTRTCRVRNGYIEIEAVSYTHLDVYKRQPEEVWRKYGSGSQEFDSEFAELRTIYGKVKAHADEVNKRTLEIATAGGYNV